MITAGDLAAMRAAQASALPDTCTRERATLTRDGSGGHTAGTPATQAYSCRVSATSGRDLEIAARLTTERTLTVTLPYDADVITTDVLIAGARRLRVIAPLPGGAWMSALRVLTVEVT